jgi:hypothetical protein
MQQGASSPWYEILCQMCVSNAVFPKSDTLRLETNEFEHLEGDSKVIQENFIHCGVFGYF